MAGSVEDTVVTGGPAEKGGPVVAKDGPAVVKDNPVAVAVAAAVAVAVAAAVAVAVAAAVAVAVAAAAAVVENLAGPVVHVLDNHGVDRQDVWELPDQWRLSAHVAGSQQSIEVELYKERCSAQLAMCYCQGY